MYQNKSEYITLKVMDQLKIKWNTVLRVKYNSTYTNMDSK